MRIGIEPDRERQQAVADVLQAMGIQPGETLAEGTAIEYQPDPVLYWRGRRELSADEAQRLMAALNDRAGGR